MCLKYSSASRHVHPSPSIGFEGILTPPLPPADEAENICPYPQGGHMAYRKAAISCLESPGSSSADISPPKIFLSRPQSQKICFPDPPVSPLSRCPNAY